MGGNKMHTPNEGYQLTSNNKLRIRDVCQNEQESAESRQC